jgi:hypothetical protein
MTDDNISSVPVSTGKRRSFPLFVLVIIITVLSVAPSAISAPDARDFINDLGSPHHSGLGCESLRRTAAEPL